MSNQTNDILFDRAREAMEYCAGKPQAKIIQMHMDDNDLDSLELAVREVERLMFEQEFNPQEAY